MADPKLVEWIKTHLDKGYSKDELRKILLERGYNINDIESAFTEAMEVKPLAELPKHKISIFKKWFNVLRHPKKMFAEEISKASLAEGAKHIVLAGIIVGFLFAIVLPVLLPLVPVKLFGAGGAMFATLTKQTLPKLQLFALAFYVPLAPIMLLIIWLIISVVLIIFAKLFGGKGSFTQQSYLIALVEAPLTLLGNIIMLFTLALILILPIGPFASSAISYIFTIALLIYNLYLLTLALRETHKFSILKSVACWAIPLIIIIGLIGLIFYSLMSIAGEGWMPIPAEKQSLLYAMRSCVGGETSACEVLTNQTDKNSCYLSCAILIKDSSLCEHITDNELKARCQTNIEKGGI